ncbi:GDP-mannose 4,6-dehydratase [Thermomicrobiaceae bacterium CFH 74404]|uniref:GDP-mannose 4,6-dehydratase n=1 Tax=Thermalbibacter longus TaxID=2951981 RepID=A0AA41WBT0_9BACT|nr:GDP-mannose 4,6-dehydratase [Thermalbibacter longus]MCM8750026.1 GDP-mannose 4,6-dehydratase [Thermalbibacter longus]
MKRALITGASGFAGRHLARRLTESGTWEVIGLSARPHTPGSELHHHLVCDLLNAELTRRTLSHWRPDVIFHLAAASYVPRSFADPAGTLVNNAVGQINLLEAARLLDPMPTVLIVSSSDVYGLVHPDELPVTEAQPFRPLSPYAVSKVAQDMLGLQYHLSYGMPVVRVRPFSHIGPEQSDRFAIASFARQIAEAEAGLAPPVLLVGNLDVERDLLDVRDVVRAYEMVATPGLAGQVFNIAGGRSWRLRDVLERLLSLSSISIEVRQDPSRLRPADIPMLRGDATALRQATGWVPEIPLEQTLADTLEYWRRSVRGCRGGRSRR